MKKILSVLFCGLFSCWSCKTAPEGIENMNAAAFNKLLQEQSIQLVDVRTETEFESGHIPGAKHVDVQNKDFNTMAEKELQKDLPIAVYCRSGMRSMRAARILKELGFKNIYNLEGGILNWKEQQLPIE